MKRYSILVLLAAFVGMLKSYATATDDNIIIEEEIQTFTIIAKNGEIASVKSETETTYTASLKDGHADAVAFYNDNISIDKASAPGVKPYYRSWQSSDVFYDGSRICYMHVPVKKDKKVKVSFQQTYKAPEHFCDIILASPYPIVHGRTVIKVPSALASRVKVNGYRLPDNIVLTHSDQSDGSVIYTAEITDLPAWKPEKGAPSAAVSAPQLVVTGIFPDVHALYSHFRKFTEGSDITSPDIDRLAAEIASKASGPKAIADSTAAWVRRNIRYLAVEHGEYAFRPAPAPDVLKNRAVDCKGSANLIKALLKSNGLDGRLVWTGTNGDVPFDWDEVPALCSGNHVIAACVLPDTTLFLDGISTWAAPGYIPPSIRGRQVIIENGDDCILTRVPDPGIQGDGEYIMARFEIEGNDLVGTISLELHGKKRAELLAASASTEPRDRQLLHKRMLNYPRKSAEASSIVMKDNFAIIDEAGNDNMGSAVISAEVVEKNAARKIGDKIYIDLEPLRDAMLEQADTAGRTRPYTLPYGYRNGYYYTIKLPEGYRPASIPDNMEVDDEWYEGKIVYKYDETEGIINCMATIQTKALEAQPNEIEKRNESAKALKRASSTQITLSPK
ncbi:MAG: transglutaminase-like domain-containing protein [Muribaculaceae bacterium]|nr:transglutaminase-like domain-containing protein [Muribaculaceae bacterium]